MDNTYKEPHDEITDKEFDVCLMKFGSLISMVFNKKINQTNLLFLILENPIFLDIFKDITEIDTPRILIKYFIQRYPLLTRSKSTCNKVTKIYQKTKDDRKRKTNL